MTAPVITAELSAQLRALLESATPVTVPSGVLVWWGPGPLPDGRPGGPILDQLGWEGCYTRLEHGALATGVVPQLPEILAPLSSRRPDEPLPVAIARFRYAMPSAKLLARVRRAAEEGRALRNPPATLQGQLEKREAFICCGLLHEQWAAPVPSYRARSVPFLITRQLMLGKPGDPRPDLVEIDPGDGGGFRRVRPDVPLEILYPYARSATVTVRASYPDVTLSASFALALSDRPPSPAPDEEWQLEGDSGNTGTAYVYRAPGRSTVRHPMIMVEGFPGAHAADYLYETLDQQQTAASLRKAGYDLVIVGLHQGTDEIQRNASVLIACIRKAIELTDEPLVVGGMSMGGLVSRYALALMEATEEPHNTCVFLTIDTPHAGSYTSLAAQWFVQTFEPYLPGLAVQAWLLNSPANQQFMRWWLHDGVVQKSPLREAFLDDLENVGNYPKDPRRLAVSCGRGDGRPSAKSGLPTLAWSGEPWLGVELHALPTSGPALVGQGHWFLADPQELPPLRFQVDRAWDVAPGGQDFYNAEVALIALSSGCGTVEKALEESCQVPTVSALDLQADPFSPVPVPGSGNTPFEDYAFCDANQPHLTITPALSKWLLSALGAPCAAEKEMSDA